ncbi:MAG: hypothetical protein VXB01_10870 [Opitutae bacterium]
MPIGNYFTARPFDNPAARTLEGDLANVIDAGAELAGKARPFLKSFVQNLNKGQQETLGSAMNVLPESANLLGRYYTGLGNTNLSFGDQYKQDLGAKVKEAHRKARFTRFKLGLDEEDAMMRMKNAEEIIKNIQAGKEVRGYDGRPVSIEQARQTRKLDNDYLAETRSRMKKMDEGFIPFMTEAPTDKGNPLTSTGTSLGSAYFKPNPDGSYTTEDETYDFMYADADRKQREAGNYKGPVSAEEEYRRPDRPSLGYAREAAEAFLGRQPVILGAQGQKYSMKDIAGASPLANIGRSVVSRFEDDPFKYNLTVRPK